MTQVLTPVADRFGTYRLIMAAAGFKLVAGVLMFVAGRRAWPVWILLFVGNRLAATAWGFYNLSFSDVSILRAGDGSDGVGSRRCRCFVVTTLLAKGYEGHAWIEGEFPRS